MKINATYLLKIKYSFDSSDLLSLKELLITLINNEPQVEQIQALTNLMIKVQLKELENYKN